MVDNLKSVATGYLSLTEEFFHNLQFPDDFKGTSGRFPNLKRGDCCLLDKMSSKLYDCFTWSLGLKSFDDLDKDCTLEKLRSAKNLEDIALFYKHYNYEACARDDPTAVIDIWGTDEKGVQKPVHAARKVKENEWWTSKMGTGVSVGYRISHPRDAFIDSPVYGKPIISFKAAPGATSPVLALKGKK